MGNKVFLRNIRKTIMQQTIGEISSGNVARNDIELFPAKDKNMPLVGDYFEPHIDSTDKEKS